MTEILNSTPELGVATCALPLDEKAYDQRMPGVIVVTRVIAYGLRNGRLPSADFWTSRLARHSATLLAARSCPGRRPTCTDLMRLGLHDAAAAMSDADLHRCAETLGLPS